MGIVDQLRSRLAAARLAVKADNGFAAAQLIMEAEQLASTLNTIRAKPLVTAALGSAGGRPKAQAKRKSNADERWDKILSLVDEIERAIGPEEKFDERWRLVEEKYRDRANDDLPVAAAEKKIASFEKNVGR